MAITRNGSQGGELTGGIGTPNDSAFRTYDLVNGAAQLTYSSGTVVLSTGTTGTGIIAALVADAGGRRLDTRPFAEGAVLLSPPGATAAQVARCRRR